MTAASLGVNSRTFFRQLGSGAGGRSLKPTEDGIHFPDDVIPTKAVQPGGRQQGCEIMPERGVSVVLRYRVGTDYGSETRLEADKSPLAERLKRLVHRMEIDPELAGQSAHRRQHGPGRQIARRDLLHDLIPQLLIDRSGVFPVHLNVQRRTSFVLSVIVQIYQQGINLRRRRVPREASVPVYVQETLRDPEPEVPRLGLLVREPWAGRLLSGAKVWEIRGQRTHIRGPIGLIAAGTGTVMGLLELTDVLGPLSPSQYAQAWPERGASPAEDGTPPYPRTYAWVMNNPVRLAAPVAYRHPPGAVIWVRLPEEVRAAIRAVCRPLPA